VTAVASPKAPTREDRAASALRAARAAFDQGEYARAVQRAQEALREDPSSAVARQILDKAERGERAEARVRAADVALQSGDLAAAEREAQAARELAPWDRTVAVLRQRISAQAREAQDDALTREQRQRQARINDLLDQGADALAAKQYDAALAAYDAVLDLDPDNAAAQTGRTGAISARSLVEAAAGGAEAPTSPTRGFVAGRSVARAPTTDSGETPAGFEASPEVEVHAATQAAALPGRLVVEASPTSPKAGDRYRVSAFLVNEGSQPIEVKGLVVTTTIDGKRRQGPVTPRASIVAPQQRALVFQLRPQLWKGDTTSWEMKIVVSTPRGETYSNTLTWK
jgi:tetratricopeptide (TPR) repeat protein